MVRMMAVQGATPAADPFPVLHPLKPPDPPPTSSSPHLSPYHLTSLPSSVTDSISKAQIMLSSESLPYRVYENLDGDLKISASAKTYSGTGGRRIFYLENSIQNQLPLDVELKVDKSQLNEWNEPDSLALIKYGFDTEVDWETSFPCIDTIIGALRTCKNEKDSILALQLHAVICHNGLDNRSDVGNNMVSMFVECDLLLRAQQIFKKLMLRNEISWTHLINGYTRYGQPSHAFDIYQKMLNELVTPSSHTFVILLNSCAGLKDVDKGMHIHVDIVNESFEKDLFVGNALVDMYCKWGFLIEAQDAFDMIPNPDIISWNSLIAGYSEHGPSDQALMYLKQMQLDGTCADAVTLSCCLKACANSKDIFVGKSLHVEITSKGLSGDHLLGTALIGMYCHCGLPADAQDVFDNLPFHDVVSWTTLIAGYVDCGLTEEVICCAERMESDGIFPNVVTFACLLKACGDSNLALCKGQDIHMKIVKTGTASNLVISNTLVGMYAKHGAFHEAQYISNSSIDRNVVTWNALITGCAEHGCHVQTLDCFDEMLLEKVSPDSMTYASVLKSCGSSGAICKGQEIHSEIAKKGLDGCSSVGNSLVTMYANCGLVVEAQEVFHELEMKDVISWTAMVKGYAINHEGGLAVNCFEEMQRQGFQADDITITCLLTACSHSNMVMEGLAYLKSMRDKYGIMVKEQHYSCIIDLLGRSGYLFEAERVVEKLAPSSAGAWAALLSSCKGHGEVELGIRCFQELLRLEPDNAAWYVLIKDIFASAGRHDSALIIEMLRMQTGAKKKPASALIEVNKTLYEFVVSDMLTEELSTMMASVDAKLKHEGHMFNIHAILKPVADQEKEAALCEHAERLAIAFGLIHTSPGHSLHVTKNLRMCNDCHDAGKAISRIMHREIILRDDCCVHHFKDGLCLCKELF